MKPAIVHIIQHLKPGGIESFVLEFQKEASKYFDVYIITLESSNYKVYWNELSKTSPLIYSLNKKPGWQISIVHKLKDLFDQIGPLYVHTHHIGPLIYGGLAARLAGIDNLVHTEHDAWHLNNTKRKLLQNLALKTLKPIFVADADFVADKVKSKLPSVTPVVIKNGVNTARFKPMPTTKEILINKYGLPHDTNFIGCAARLEEVKGHKVLIAALAHLPKSVALLLAGTGSLRQDLQDYAQEKKVADRVFFLGHIEKMENFYPLLDVFCLSSLNEGFPLSPLEAQACNVPVVLTNVGGCKEATCQHTGYLVEPNSPELLAEALNLSLSNKPKMNPREFVVQHCSLTIMIKQYLSLFNEELRGKLC